MRILIIEDEHNAADDLQLMLVDLKPEFVIAGITDSIENTLQWLNTNGQPDLIFCDIQLGDGLSFIIFEQFQISCPVIFTTAYDEFAIKAFENNGIDYLLKPIDEQKLSRSLKKIEDLSIHLAAPANPLKNLTGILNDNYKNYRSSFLIAYKGKRFPLEVKEIAFFMVKNSFTLLYTMQGKSYMIPQRLEELEDEMLNPMDFFRINRQYLVAFKAIKEVEEYFGRKTLVHLNMETEEKVFVSKPRSSQFLRWLENR